MTRAFWNTIDEIGTARGFSTYRLSDWGPPERRQYAAIRAFGSPSSTEPLPAEYETFLRMIQDAPTASRLGQLPYFCSLMLDQLTQGSQNQNATAIFRRWESENDLVEGAWDRIVERDRQKGILQDSSEIERLREIAEYLACESVRRSYCDLVIKDIVPELEILLDMREQDLAKYLNAAVFDEGANKGTLRFSHEIIADYLVAQYCLRLIRREPIEGFNAAAEYLRMRKEDLTEAPLVAFLSDGVRKRPAEVDLRRIQSDTLTKDGFRVFVQVANLVRPDPGFPSNWGIRFSGRDLSFLRFEGSNFRGMSLAGADLTGTIFLDCDMSDADLRGCILDRTSFDERTCGRLQNANFGDLKQFRSARIAGEYISERAKIAGLLARFTAKHEARQDPCSVALQMRRLFERFYSPTGEPLRSEIKEEDLYRGKVFVEKPDRAELLRLLKQRGYLLSSPNPDRVRRPTGDRLAEVINLVKKGILSQGLGGIAHRVCRMENCRHLV